MGTFFAAKGDYFVGCSAGGGGERRGLGKDLRGLFRDWKSGGSMGGFFVLFAPLFLRDRNKAGGVGSGSTDRQE